MIFLGHLNPFNSLGNVKSILGKWCFIYYFLHVRDILDETEKVCKEKS